MISYSDRTHSWGVQGRYICRFQTLPGMISYSDGILLRCRQALYPGFKPFQGWFPILTGVSWEIWIGSSKSFKPFQGWFPILTQRCRSVLRDMDWKVSNPSRDDFLFWLPWIYGVQETGQPSFKPFQGWFPILTTFFISLNLNVLKFQTLPGMISYSDWKIIFVQMAKWDGVSNPSRDDFLFWQRDLRYAPKWWGKGFKPFQGWFPILTFKSRPGRCHGIDVSNPSRDDFLFWLNTPSFNTQNFSESFKPFQGWFPILTLLKLTLLQDGWWRFQTLPGMISYSDRYIKQPPLYRWSVSNPSRDDFLFWHLKLL